MQSTINNLIKFFQLEKNQNYANRSVIGGFENLLPTWEKDARNQNLPPQLIDQVISNLSQYQNEPHEKRVEIIQELLSVLKSEFSSAEEQPAKPIPRVEPAKKIINTPPPPKKQTYLEAITSKSTFKDETQSENSISYIDSKKGFTASLQTIPGIGPAKASALQKLGLITLEDLIYFFPRRYEDYSKLLPINRLTYGENVTVIGSVKSINSRASKTNKIKITEVILEDGTGSLRVTFFNQPYLYKRLFKGLQIFVSGKTEMYLGRLVINNPYWEKVDQKRMTTNRIVPIYKLTKNITQGWLRKIVDTTVSQWTPRVKDYLPVKIKSEANLMNLNQALYDIHNPSSFNQLEIARERIAFDEIFFLQLGVLQQRKNWQNSQSSVFTCEDQWLDNIYQALPYQLTSAQQKAIAEIRKDLTKGIPMSRLVQGDVGSGKTMVAIITSAIVSQTGSQTAIMAPTSILAEQHFQNFSQFFVTNQLLNENQIRLLVGNTPEAEKELIREGLKSGEIKIIIGTHALLEDPVTFNNLEYVVIDEQHRFGVSQRAILREKGNSPHILVMTATPIPRSLALTVYGDLDISVMDEMPPGRKPVLTHIVSPMDRERAYQLIRNQVKEGKQAFIIYPLISVEEQTSDEQEDESPVENQENETVTNAAVNEFERLQKDIFPSLRLGLLHGKMRPDEKDNIMQGFKFKNYDILISTTVVEVGVDIPNASVMIIEGANRFGLAQLHQLRGRVGRGTEKSYCLLIPENEDALENERLKVMEETNDGFILAEKDLSQRGPGDFLGTRQSGYKEMNLSNLTNVKLIEKARTFAQKLFETDPDLNQNENQPLREILNHYWKIGTGDVS